jgi:hypothetical protein
MRTTKRDLEARAERLQDVLPGLYVTSERYANGWFHQVCMPYPDSSGGMTAVNHLSRELRIGEALCFLDGMVALMENQRQRKGKRKNRPRRRGRGRISAK